MQENESNANCSPPLPSIDMAFRAAYDRLVQAAGIKGDSLVAFELSRSLFAQMSRQNLPRSGDS